MNELDVLRSEIDRIDKEILPLFLKRMEVCGKVAEYKGKIGMPVLDSERERQVLENKMKLLKSSEMAEEVYEFFSSVMSISRLRQGRLLSGVGENNFCARIIESSEIAKAEPKIVYYGSNGSYSEIATMEYFGKESNRFCSGTFDGVFASLDNGAADYAVLPIENSSTGMIADVADLLVKYKFNIVGEVCVPIRHCLLGLKGADISDIKKVYSHEQAILQCRDYLSKLKGVECESYYSTSVSAKAVADGGDKTKAAIASAINADVYGLDILARDINTSGCNTTRFAIISKHPEINENCNKISVAFTLKHEVGQLSRILADFARGGLDLLKLESRPIAERPFNYRFFADYTGNIIDKNVREITDTAVAETQDFVLFGNYVAYSDKSEV